MQKPAKPRTEVKRKVGTTKFPDGNFCPVKSLKIPGNQEDGRELIPAC